MSDPVSRSNWILYGAYGTTGRLILDESLRRGHRPLLAGRDPARLRALGEATGLNTVPLPLENAAALRAALSGVRCVLLAAGPYQLTGPLMRAACVETGCSYLDINAELEDFSQALACDEAARTAGIGVIPGVGYGVVFAECVAAQVARLFER
jgi:saccharopine dehydrogenase (NAD+, L-lysine-forming)